MTGICNLFQILMLAAHLLDFDIAEAVRREENVAAISRYDAYH
jgi:phosphoribosylformylglycinamidine (FGAM) synthase-like amidotransferase family enzyme